MKKILLLFALIWSITAQAQLTFTAPVAYWTGVPTGAPSVKGSRIAANLLTNRLYQWDSVNSTWDLIPYGIDEISGTSAPSYTPGVGDSPFAINHVTPNPELYYYFSGSWHLVGGSGGGGGATDLTFTGSGPIYTLNSSTGTDVQLEQWSGMTLTRSGNKLIFAAIDSSKINELNASFDISGGNLRVTDAGGTLTVPLTSIAPVQALSAGTGISISGTSTRTITNTGDLSNTNELQNLSLSGQNLGISSGTGVTLPVVGITAGSGISVTPSAGNYTITNIGGVTWPLLAPDGSISAPSYSFSGSTGTGIFRDGGLIIQTPDAAIGESVSVRAGATSLDEEYGGGIEITSGAGNGANSTGGSLVLTSGAAPDGIGGNFVLQSGSGLIGGNFNMQSGTGTQQGGNFTAISASGGVGGGFFLTAGNSTDADAVGGQLAIIAGNNLSGFGGPLDIRAGNGGEEGGPIAITAGNGVSGIGGDVSLNPGIGITAANNGKVVVIGNGVVLPPLTTAQRDALIIKTEGQTIWNRTLKKQQIWDGTAWLTQ
jgi:hypothetical protein